MVYEVLPGKMLTVTGPCRVEVVGTDEVFLMTDVPVMEMPTPPDVENTLPEPTGRKQ